MPSPAVSALAGMWEEAVALAAALALPAAPTGALSRSPLPPPPRSVPAAAADLALRRRSEPATAGGGGRAGGGKALTEKRFFRGDML